jgi:hypothetical protein
VALVMEHVEHAPKTYGKVPGSSTSTVMTGDLRGFRDGVCARINRYERSIQKFKVLVQHTTTAV